MIRSKTLVKMAKKWQKFVAAQRKRISFPKDVKSVNADRLSCSSPTTSSTKSDKGCFTVYSADQLCFRIPLNYLNNEIFKELLHISKEEFGLPSDRPIILPLDANMLDYIISMIQRGSSGDVRKSFLMSIAMSRCSLPSVHQELRNCQLLVY